MTEISFEGDGILGIEWGNEMGQLIVKNIQAMTVADEYYELEKGLIVKQINDQELDTISYIKKVSMIMEIWRKENKIKISFEEKKKEEYLEIHQFLEENGFLNYYEKFIELGARTIEDFEFIEINDLYKMGMTIEKADRLYRKIRMKSNSEVFEEL
jgi:peptidyl-tRNA hydrolase